MNRKPGAGLRPAVGRILLGSALVLAGLFAAGCASVADKPPVGTARSVDLERYMGPWYILASIPLSFEEGAHNPVESYTRNPDGSIATVFQFRRDAFDGELVTHVTNAVVVEGTGDAVWRIRLLWPFRTEYRIGYVEPDYSYAIITRSKRDHVWLIGRKPIVGEADYSRYRKMIGAMGYDLSKFNKTAQNGEFPTPGLKVTK